MTPEQEQRLKNVETMLAMLLASDRYTVQKHVQLFDARNIQLGRTTGTKIGTATDQKLGFFGKTPVVQPAAISSPSGGATVDSAARTAIDDIRSRLQSLGLTA